MEEERNQRSTAVKISDSCLMFLCFDKSTEWMARCSVVFRCWITTRVWVCMWSSLTAPFRERVQRKSVDTGVGAQGVVGIGVEE